MFSAKYFISNYFNRHYLGPFFYKQRTLKILKSCGSLAAERLAASHEILCPFNSNIFFDWLIIT